MYNSTILVDRIIIQLYNSTMIQTNISLHQTQHDLIKEECHKLGYSLSFFIRELVDDYFGKKPLKKAVKEWKPQKNARIETVEDVKKVIKPKGNLCEHGVPKTLCKQCMFK